MEENLSDSIKKNILDLQYNKYLQYYNTAIIVLFTYFIGVGITFLTKQVNISDQKQFLLLVVISIIIVTPTTIFMLYFKNQQKSILDEIKTLHL